MNPPEQEQTNYREVEETKNNVQDSNSFQLFGKQTTETGSLDKIRDILFGNQSRDYEQRFSRLEERLAKECSNLREDTKKRLDSIEIYLKNEVDALTERLKTEKSERDEALQELNQDFKNLIKSLEKKVVQLEEQTSQNHRDLRQQLFEQSKHLDEEIKQKYGEILTVLEGEAKDLRSNKTDRSTLATLFAELALRLNSDS